MSGDYSTRNRPNLSTSNYVIMDVPARHETPSYLSGPLKCGRPEGPPYRVSRFFHLPGTNRAVRSKLLESETCPIRVESSGIAICCSNGFRKSAVHWPLFGGRRHALATSSWRTARLWMRRSTA